MTITYEVPDEKMEALLDVWRCANVEELTARMREECIRPARRQEVAAKVQEVSAELADDWAVN